jgi:hypothetical protein
MLSMLPTSKMENTIFSMNIKINSIVGKFAFKGFADVEIKWAGNR